MPTFIIDVQNWVNASDRLQVLRQKSLNSVKGINLYVLRNKHTNYIQPYNVLHVNSVLFRTSPMQRLYPVKSV